MSLDIYKEIILDHYKHPRNFGHLPREGTVAQVNNPLCGDDITMELEITNNKVVDIRFHGQGCAIAIASASLLTEFAKNQKLTTLTTMNKDSMLELLSVELSPNRLKCALVSLEALQKAIKTHGLHT
ncbi:MAG: NifU-like protein [Microgenomates bacterium OLB23]|nr:MAG: NifU-like protein [Microgenomates bacterium OLB23]